MNRIQDELKIIEGKPIIDIGRASNLLWIHFGECIQVKNYKGIGMMKGEYALHIQCPWRLVQNNRILLGSNDFYSPSTALGSAQFEWDIAGANMFDEKLEIIKKILPCQVEEIKVDDIGNLNICFKKKNKLEVFIVDSAKVENWRFINNITGEHIVVFE